MWHTTYISQASQTELINPCVNIARISESYQNLRMICTRAQVIMCFGKQILVVGHKEESETIKMKRITGS